MVIRVYTCIFAVRFIMFAVNRLKTPLHVAADKGHFDLIDVLLKHGAKVNCCTLFKFVPSLCLRRFLKCVSFFLSNT